MKQSVLVVGTIVIFVAGALTGRWYESHRPLPPPPALFMGEFGGHHYGEGRPPLPQVSRADMLTEVERVRPQFEAFQKRMDDIEDQFEHSLDEILTPEQRALNAERIKQRAKFRSENGNEENLMRLARLPNMALLHIVTLQLGYDSLNQKLKFDASQHDRVFELLRVRRDHFLAFIDGTPPPSLRLLHLAPYTQGLAPPAPGPQAGSQP
jgi:hypothetical protein